MKVKKPKPVCEPMYEISTYNYETGKYTPQEGIRKGPFTLWEIREVLRELQGMGYMARRGDNDVMVERVEAGQLFA